MRHLDHSLHSSHEVVDLRIAHDQRWRRFQHHEIISADLSQYVVVAEQPPYQNLSEHRRMNSSEGFVGESRRGLLGRAKLEPSEQTYAANLPDHCKVRKLVAERCAKILTHFERTLSQFLAGE